MTKKASASRRRFLRQSAAASAAMALPWGALPAQATVGNPNRALVCVFLGGGWDSDNIVVPLNGTARQHYDAERGAFGIPWDTALPLASGANNPYGESTDWGLHPSLSNLAGFAQQNALAVIGNMGTLVRPTTKQDYLSDPSFHRPERLFSHSDQVAQMHSGRPQLPSSSGWMGRLVDLFAPTGGASLPMGVSMAGSSLILNGETSQQASLSANYNLAPRARTSAEREARADALTQLQHSGANMLERRANKTFATAISLGEQLEQARLDGPAESVEFPTSSIGRQLRNVAELLRLQGVGLLAPQPQVFFVHQGGYDNHSNETPILANLLQQLDEALGAFGQELAAINRAHEVTTFTLTDFGRTYQVNSNAGTDHAWGYHGLVMGGAVAGGLHGHFPLLDRASDSSTDQRGRWIPTTAVDEVGSALARWMGVSAPDLATVFPNIDRFPDQLQVML